MCLLNAKEIKTIKEDITCFKVFKFHGELLDKTVLYSPSYEKRWKKGELYSTGNTLPSFGYESFNLITGISVHEQAYHSFKNVDDAISYARTRKSGTDLSLCVCECTIPKNTKYLYMGRTLLRGFEAYASERLRIKKYSYCIY